MKISCICFAVVTGCTATSQRQHTTQVVKPHSEFRAEGIALSTAVSKDRATILAESYYRDHYGFDEGAIRYAGETSTHWLFDVLIGFAGSVEGTVHISKTDGVVSYEPM